MSLELIIFGRFDVCPSDALLIVTAQQPVTSGARALEERALRTIHARAQAGRLASWQANSMLTGRLTERWWRPASSPAKVALHFPH